MCSLPSSATPTDEQRQRLSANLRSIRDEIAAAAARNGRSAASVRLVVVTKYANPRWLPALLDCGVSDFGENRVQQLVARAASLAREAAPPPTWHMIGHLQRNKVRSLLSECRHVHSIDSVRLLAELERAASAASTLVQGFLELNVAGESAKTGAPVAALDELLSAADRAPHVKLAGLMTMAPYSDDPETARPHFARLRAALEDARRRGAAPADFDQLSMGMSGDFAVAVEEGATVVRIGSRVFEGLSAS